MTVAAVRAQAAEALACWRVQPGAFLVIGRGELPASGVAEVGGAPLRGQFRTAAWTGANGPAFMAAVRLPDRAPVPRGAVLVLRGAAASTTLPLPDAETEAAFGQHAARLAGPHAPQVARFMLDALRAPAGHDVPAVGIALRAFLSQAAQADGCIEIMAAVPDSCVLLQGWGAPLSGAVQVILAGAGMLAFAAQAGEFARADIAAPATGTVLALPPAAAGALAGADHVFVLSSAGLHSRALVEHRLLDPAASLGHLRHVLPALRCPAPMRALLAEALRPRFDGTDTLSRNEHKVRAAFDCVLVSEGAGAYVSGWVFDPLKLLAAVHLCDAAGFSARLDDRWTPVPRPDVTEAYRDQPGFPAPADDDAGVAVWVPGVPGSGLHLQFGFADGGRAFLPLTAADPACAPVRARLLAGIDLFKPSGLAIIERQAAPLLSRVQPRAPGAPELIRQGGGGQHAVVSVLAGPMLPRALIADLLADPLAADERLLLLCRPEWTTPALDRLLALAEFYRLDATVLRQEATAPPAAGGGQASMLLVEPGVTGRTPGWRAALRGAAPEADWVCPTLLYEDFSVRFAGSAGVRLLAGAPYAQVQVPAAGLPAPEPEGAAEPSAVGTLACCLLRGAALAVPPAPGAFSTAWGQEAAFFRAAAVAGLRGAWAPSVQVWAPEAEAASGTRAAALADGWMLRQSVREEARACAS